MIVVEEGPDLLLVTQPDHARFAADLLALWQGAGLPGNPRRAALLFACREHDNGWREADAAPRCGPDGRPYDFIGIPAEARFEAWRRGTARYLREHPYVALLITRHALALHRRYQGAGADEFRAELAAREEDLRRETGVAESDLAADYRLLDLADNLSLAVCMRNPRPLVLVGVRARFLPDQAELAIAPPPLPALAGAPPSTAPAMPAQVAVPGPLAAPPAARLPYRRIPRRSYGGDADLGGELAAAHWLDLVVRLVALAD